MTGPGPALIPGPPPTLTAPAWSAVAVLVEQHSPNLDLLAAVDACRAAAWAGYEATTTEGDQP